MKKIFCLISGIIISILIFKCNTYCIDKNVDFNINVENATYENGVYYLEKNTNNIILDVILSNFRGLEDNMIGYGTNIVYDTNKIKSITVEEKNNWKVTGPGDTNYISGENENAVDNEVSARIILELNSNISNSDEIKFELNNIYISNGNIDFKINNILLKFRFLPISNNKEEFSKDLLQNNGNVLYENDQDENSILEEKQNKVDEIKSEINEENLSNDNKEYNDSNINESEDLKEKDISKKNTCIVIIMICIFIFILSILITKKMKKKIL